MPINQLTEDGFGMIVGSVGSSFTGLLDTYGGAAAAYSVRRLSSTYTGNLIEVRRSSDNTTQDIGYGADNLFDTSLASSFIGVNDGFDRTFYDQSGNTNNAQQTTTSNQPQIYSSGSPIVINSVIANDFDGIFDSLITWNNTTAPTIFQNLGSDLTIITRVSTGNAINLSNTIWQSRYTIVEIRQNNSIDAKIPFSIGVSGSKLKLGLSDDYISGAEEMLSTLTLTTNTDYYFGITVTGTTVKLFINGSLDSTHTITTALGDRSVGASNSTFSIGCRSRDGGQADSNAWNGKINEVIIWGSCFNDSDVISIMNNSIL